MSVTAIASSQSGTRPSYDLKVRPMDFEFPEDIPEFWYANDPFRTVLAYALSGGFPEGERFFIDSVRYFQDRIQDPELKRAIRSFIGQEGHHSKEHHALNEWIESRGYPVSRIHQDVGKMMRLYRKYLSPERQLAKTAALEHFTAIMAEHYMLNLEELGSMDPRMAKLWAWHAIEEAEHKSVAFDVFKTVSNNEWIRLSEMVTTTFNFVTFTTLDMILLMRHSGRMTDFKMWLGGLNYFWGRPGVFRKMIPAYLQYYRRDFHPSQYDGREQREKVKKEYLAED